MIGNNLKKEFSSIRIVLLLLPLILSFVITNSFYRDILILVMLWSAAASAWNLLGGYAGQLSIGHAAFFGIGAYTSTLIFIHFSISPWIGMLVGGLVASIIGVILGSLTFPLKGPFFSLSTIAFAEIIRILAIGWSDLTKGSAGIVIPYKTSFSNMIFENQQTVSIIIWLAMIGMYLVSIYFSNSKLGYYLMAYRENEDAARALGINTLVVRLKAVAVSAFLTALLGSFFAQYVLYIDPESLFIVDNSLQMVLLSLVGGVGTTIGPIIGGYIMIPLGQLLRAFFGGIAPGLHLVIYGLCLVLILLYLPKGLVSLFKKPISFSPLKWFRRTTPKETVSLNKGD
ncbi:branched-chain amino acid ABC transporter permease [Bacillus sp. ISL-75]|uniref:branched-chain amino acid ABC transporter permease n=1 Tax=Bacillus sp. ISL-75 TaxID=2819137 RepID=UPI001BEA638D|nr:branched-chain amino acid ABC transporter permease [Bacillus sp. ISL-75]MBT2730174.1 branched-chain amino acid ABC transporter permease [Bacillus sp. ISL-75]